MDTSLPVTSSGIRRGMLALLAFCHLIISLDYTIVFVALPDIGGALGFNAQTLQWVVSAYVVPYGGFLLLGGRTCDLVGKRFTLILGLALFALASLAGGFADSRELLVGARAVQGLGGALLFPATLSLIGSEFAEGAQRNHALSVWAGVGGSGMALGALAGGILTDRFGWGAVFLVNVPLALMGIAWALYTLAPDRPRDRSRRFDIAGALAGTCGVSPLVYVLVMAPEAGWTSRCVLLAAGGSVALLAVFALIESRTRDALLPLRLFGNRSLTLGMAVILLFTATFGSLLYFLSIYYQSVLGMSALDAGLAYLPLYAVIFLASSSGGRVAGALGVRTATLFTLTASLSLLNFWNLTGKERTMMMNAFMNNMALTGGLLVIVARS